MTAAIILGVVIIAAAAAACYIADAITEMDRQQQANLAQQADDHGEPARADIEWDMIRAAVDDTPIYNATAAHIARHAAASIDDEWSAWGGGAA